MATFERNLQTAIKTAASVLCIEDFRDSQSVCLRHLILGRDVIACLPTGYGKSLIYQAWPIVCRELARLMPNMQCQFVEDAMVLVVSPLLAIMEDQVQSLQSRGVPSAYAGKDLETDTLIAAGHYTVVYGSPETFGHDKWRNVLQTAAFRERLVGVAVDEVHTVTHWGEGHGSEAPFREWCGNVGELRSLLPSSLPLLAITATASKASRKKLRKYLGMQQCVELVKSPDRANVRLAIQKISADPASTFAWLCRELERKGPNTEKVVIYCKSIAECSLLYSDVFRLALGKRARHPVGAKDVSSNRLVDMFHSETPEDVKIHIINSLQDPLSVLRVVIATSALGMGVDFKGVNQVINYGPPRNIEDYIQAFGRAGRDGSQAHSLILYHGRQLKGLSEEMLQYVSANKQCLRAKILHLFDGEKTEPLELKHACCGFCALSCNCNDTCDGGATPLEKHVEGKGPL